MIDGPFWVQIDVLSCPQLFATCQGGKSLEEMRSVTLKGLSPLVIVKNIPGRLGLVKGDASKVTTNDFVASQAPRP